MKESTKRFCELMLTYIVDNNWNNVERLNPVLPERYAVLIGLSFSAVIKTEYTSQPVPGEICRVPIYAETTRESLIKAFVDELDD